MSTFRASALFLLAASAGVQFSAASDLDTSLSAPAASSLSTVLTLPDFASPLVASQDFRNDARTAGGGWLDDDGGRRTAAPRPAPAGSKATRSTYLAYQTALSTYVYGVGLPLGLGVTEPRVLIATPLIAAPLLFGVHLGLSNQMDITESHLKASMYIPTAAVYSATALSLAFASDAGEGYRIGSLVGAGAYPLGLWYAHHLGDEYRSDPNQLDAKMMFALFYGFVGLVTPVLYFEHPGKHDEEIVRLGLAQSVGMGVVGHVVADYYAPNAASTGALLGLATHAALGGLTGIAVASYADASVSLRPWLGSAIVGTTLGFTEGVFFFRDSRDSRERAQYAGLGAAGGMTMGLGLQILFYNGDASAYAQKASWASFLVGGALVGYAATYALTGNLVESASIQRAPGRVAYEPSRWTFNPVPEPEAFLSRGEPARRWKVPGVTYRF